jgi:hypothetical protein
MSPQSHLSGAFSPLLELYVTRWNGSEDAAQARV